MLLLIFRSFNHLKAMKNIKSLFKTIDKISIDEYKEKFSESTLVNCNLVGDEFTRLK
jgi:hypothetical protein